MGDSVNPFRVGVLALAFRCFFGMVAQVTRCYKYYFCDRKEERVCPQHVGNKPALFIASDAVA